MTTINRNFLFLLLLIIVVGGVFLTQSEMGKDYAEWIKITVESKLGFLKAGLSSDLVVQESELDISDINFDNLLTEETVKTELESGQESTKQGQKIYTAPDVISEPISRDEILMSIQEEINVIQKKADEIEIKVKELEILIAIQKSINQIAVEADVLAQKMENMDNFT